MPGVAQGAWVVDRIAQRRAKLFQRQPVFAASAGQALAEFPDSLVVFEIAWSAVVACGDAVDDDCQRRDCLLQPLAAGLEVARGWHEHVGRHIGASAHGIVESHPCPAESGDQLKVVDGEERVLRTRLLLGQALDGAVERGRCLQDWLERFGISSFHFSFRTE